MKNHLRSTLLLLLFLFVISQSLFAQDKISVSGTVTDAADGGPIPGVAVTIKGTTLGTATDAQGNYQLKGVDGKGTLIFAYLGYKSLEVAINNRTAVNAALELSTQALEQVVVVGYGTAKKKDLTASIANVKGEELAKQPIQTPTQAMQGKVAGVQIIASGEPNSQPSVRIRGTGSTLGGVEPLYVVDGVLTDDIRNINNSDIASMDVLKDASAAIYGVRAANGVIIITTKKGKDGKTVVRYDGNVGTRKAANLVDMANREEYVDYLSTAAPNKVAEVNGPLTVPGTVNWYDNILRSAFQTNHNISLSGGTEKYNYYFSTGYLQEDGIITTNDFDRFTFRANNEATISPKFKFSSQISYSRGENRAVELGDTYRNIYRAAPIVPTKIENKYGNTSAWGNVGNPLLSMEKRNNEIRTDRIQGNVGLDYFIIKELRFRTVFNADKFFSKNRTYNYQFAPDTATFTVAGGGQRVDNSRLNVKEEDNFRWVWDNTLTFEKTFNEKNNFTAVFGAVTEEGTTSFVTGERINVPEAENLWFLSQGDPNVQATNDNGGTKFSRQSFVTRISYNYASKYLFTGSFRADGSSKFREKWGYFPTLGFGWVLSEEKFMAKQKLFDFLKLRVNWGILGNDAIPSDSYISILQTNIPYFFDNAIVQGATIPQIKDQNVQWEKTHEFDIGLDFTLLDNRLSGELDYYDKDVKDALTNVTIPGIFGDADNIFLTNAASFKNRGFEFALRWENLIKEDFKYNIGFNITYNHNEVTDLSGGQAIFAGGVGQQGNITKTDTGQPVGSFFVLNDIGIFQSQEEINAYVGADGVTPIQPNAVPGDFKYEDYNTDGRIDLNDRQFFGSYQPKFYYGINLGASYKGFDLSADFYGNAGNEVYNGKKAFRFEATDNIEADYANARWKADRPSNTDPRLITGTTQASDYFIESGSFFRLNNLTVGYTIPEKAFGKSISSLRFYVTAQNLFTIKDFSGFSAELPGGALDSGIELSGYPTTRTFAFGVNLSF